MGLKDDITTEVKEILDWKIEVTNETKKVPDKSDLTLGETAKRLDTCVLYVDMRGSSKLTESHRSTTVAKIYNAYLNAMVRIAKSHWGQVRSFNGDSILVFFDPNMPNSVRNLAVKTAMQMQWVASQVIKPAIKAKGYEDDFQIGVGVTYGTVFVTKAGLRGTDNNDLIWPSTPVNLAAKLGDTAGSDFHIYISKEVYDGLTDDWKYVETQYGTKVNMWTNNPFFQFAGDFVSVYKTNYHCSVD